MEDLVSKKDLLLDKEISYGQLYRWKRKGLIPEGWFINKPTKTGQETFFKKDDIYSRIDEINFLKEKMSLDEMKNYFSGEILRDIKISKNDILGDDKVSSEILEIYEKLYIKSSSYSSLDLLYIYIGSSLFVDYGINIETIFILIKEINRCFNKDKNFNFKISIYKKLGILIPLIHKEDSIYFFDGEIVLKNYDINKLLDKVKKYSI